MGGHACISVAFAGAVLRAVGVVAADVGCLAAAVAGAVAGCPSG